MKWHVLTQIYFPPVTPTTPKPMLSTTTKPSQSKNNGDCAYECAHMPNYCSARRGSQSSNCFGLQFGGFCVGTVSGCVGCKTHCNKNG